MFLKNRNYFILRKNKLERLKIMAKFIRKMWKPFTRSSKKDYNFFTVPLQSMLYLALQLGRVLGLET